MKTTRRDLLKGGGKAVVAAAALPTITVGASGDAELLSLIEEFWAAHEEADQSSEKWHVEYKRVHALPEFPPHTDRKAHDAFFEEHTNHALFDISNKANKRQGRAAKAVFDNPAKTYQGVLAKLKIVELAYGSGNEDGDTDLEVFQDTNQPWLANAIVDLERLAGVTSSTVAPETTGEDPFAALAREWAEQKAECERLSKAEEEAWERLPRWVRDDKGAPQRLNPKTGLMKHYISGERRELMARMKSARDEAGTTELGVQSDAAQERLGEIEKRISETPTTTLLGIVTKLRVEASMEVEYEFWTTEHMVKTALAGAEYLLAQSKKAV